MAMTHGPAEVTDTMTDRLRVPAALDQPDPARRFSAAAMRRRLKVLFLISQPTRSPAISVHRDLWRFLNRDRVEVHVAYPRLAADEPYRSRPTSLLPILPTDPGVHLLPVELGPVGGAPRTQLLTAAARSALPAVRDTTRLIRFIRRAGIDIVHAEEGSRNAGYAYLLTRLSAARYVVHFHSQYGDWMSPPSRWGTRHADGIIAVTAWTGRGIARDGVPPGRIFPVLNGIDPSGFDPGAHDGEIRRELGLEPSDPLVVMVAQLVEWKRQHTMITAFERVLAVHPRARLMLVGTEWQPAASGSYTERLHQLVAELGLGERVIFAGYRSDVRAIMAAADIFALPSVGEPFGLVFAEAMAMGLPVVAADAGGPPEVVVDGETGLLSPPDDTEQLAANVITLIDDPELRRRLGGAGRRRVLEHLNAQRMADDVEAVYREVCGLESLPSA